MRISTMRRSILLTVFAAAAAAAAVALGACTNTPEGKPPVTPVASPSPGVSPTASPAVSPTGSPTAGEKTAGNADALVGRWPGVEGTYLDIAKKGDKYSVAIRNLDGVQTFEAIAAGSTIEFARKGKTETVRAATGNETGMKWFLSEKNCVVINKGSEGYCRK